MESNTCCMAVNRGRLLHGEGSISAVALGWPLQPTETGSCNPTHQAYSVNPLAATWISPLKTLLSNIWRLSISKAMYKQTLLQSPPSLG